MTGRKMWAERHWECGAGAGLFVAPPSVPGDTGVVPVLVTDAEGMPFEVGDEVEIESDREVGTIMAMAKDPYEKWSALLKVPYGIRAAYCQFLTKLPRETTELPTYRITGDPESVKYTLHCIDRYATGSEWEARVERVEDPDAKAER